MSEQKHLLIINLGRGSYEGTTYVLPDETHVSTLIAGLALWKWLETNGQSPASVVFACTGVAWHDRSSLIEEEVGRLGLPGERLAPTIELEMPRTLDAIWGLLPPLEKWIKESAADGGEPPVLHVDLTHAFRAIPLAHTWLALYLQRRGFVTHGVWGYGAFDPNAKELTPYLDLSHLLQLAEWAEAVRAFRDRLDTSAVASLLDPQERSARRAAVAAGSKPPGQLSAVVRAAKAAGEPFRAGLPLEVGLAAREHLGSTTSAAVRDAAAGLGLGHVAPLAEELFQELQRLAVVAVAKSGAKRQLALEEAEIQRQLRVVKAFARVGMVDAALRALRELIVNRVLLAWGSGGASWLERPLRERAERRLAALALKPAPRPLSPEEEDLAVLWRELRSRRNPLAHAGMQGDTVNPGEAKHALETRLLPGFCCLHPHAPVWQLADLPEGPAEKDDDA